MLREFKADGRFEPEEWRCYFRDSNRTPDDERDWAMIKKHRYGGSVKEQLRSAARDRLYRFLMAEGTVRGAILHGTRMINEMRANHELGILETLALGHAYLAAGLLTASLKGQDRIALQITCSGPIRGIEVEANAYGEVRGHLKQVPFAVEAPVESFNLSPFFGAGLLKITKYLEDAKQPFSGQVALVHGSIAKDLAHYFFNSEQIPTAFSLSIQFDPRGEAVGAGGLYFQVLPGATDEIVAELENRVSAMPSIGNALAAGSPPEALVRDAFGALEPKFLDDARVAFMCHCNLARIRSMLTLLPIEDLRDIRNNGPFPLEIRCHHCNTAYAVPREDVEKIFAMRYPNN